MRYFKKNWEETTGDELTDDWGVSIFYFETDDSLNFLKQIQIFENGNILKYDELNNEDEFGAMADQSLEEEEFLDCEISKEEFYNIWNK
ncbi:hypothetical protein [Cloacibacterium normanense]|uniref:hypothetical protein n=1 Tax=Cloacibacterium normanense TaxID=237258 RepID=UPI00391C9E3C